MGKRILLTAFKNTSAELLLKDVYDFPILLLPNDKRKDSEKLIASISKPPFDLVVSIGQRPNIKDKVHVETTAREGEKEIVTDFDYDSLVSEFAKNGIPSKCSCNAGTSYCNQLYWNGLRYLSQSGLGTQMVFIHIPFFKNISDFDGFRKRFMDTITSIKEGQYGSTGAAETMDRRK